MPRAFTEPERLRIRRLLLDAGRGALARGGLRRVPIERLAAAVGISKGAFYLFFPSKEALVVELLLQAEAELRTALVARVDAAGPECLRAVLELLFASVDQHPLLHVLGDAEEMAWLERALPEGHTAAARADDDTFFSALLTRLREVGAVRADVDPSVFAGLPAAAFAVAHHRALIGPERHDGVVGLIVDGLVARLATR